MKIQSFLIGFLLIASISAFDYCVDELSTCNDDPTCNPAMNLANTCVKNTTNGFGCAQFIDEQNEDQNIIFGHSCIYNCYTQVAPDYNTNANFNALYQCIQVDMLGETCQPQQTNCFSTSENQLNCVTNENTVYNCVD
jgi:hypothetical protein